MVWESSNNSARKPNGTHEAIPLTARLQAVVLLAARSLSRLLVVGAFHRSPWLGWACSASCI